jgi:hypothetical protein
LDIGIRCSFLLNFIIINLITIYSSYEISLRNFESIRAAVGKLYFILGGCQWTMAGYWIQVQFFAQFCYCISHYGLFQLRNKPTKFQKDSRSCWKVIFYWGGVWLDIGIRRSLLLNFIIAYLIVVYSSYEISL